MRRTGFTCRVIVLGLLEACRIQARQANPGNVDRLVRAQDFEMDVTGKTLQPGLQLGNETLKTRIVRRVLIYDVVVARSNKNVMNTQAIELYGEFHDRHVRTEGWQARFRLEGDTVALGVGEEDVLHAEIARIYHKINGRLCCQFVHLLYRPVQSRAVVEGLLIGLRALGFPTVIEDMRVGQLREGYMLLCRMAFVARATSGDLQ